MSLESGTYVNDLVTTNPLGSDAILQGDDHLRLVKTLLKATFPNADKAFYFPDAAAKTGNYTVLATDINKFFTGDATGGAFSFTLPTLGASNDGWYTIIQKIDATANALTVVGTINGLTNLTLTAQWDAILVWWSGSAWYALTGLRNTREVQTRTAGATLTLADVDNYIICTPGANMTLVLPAAASWKGRTIAFKQTTSSFTTTLDGNAAETIDGNATMALSVTNDSMVLFSDGTNIRSLYPVFSTISNTFTVAQTFNAPVIFGETTLTDAGTIAWNLAAGGPNYVVTLGGNRTLGAASGGVNGQTGYLRVLQDGTGGRTLDLSNAVYDFRGGFIENVDRAASAETLYRYRVVSATAIWLERVGSTNIANGRDLLYSVDASSSATIDIVLSKWLQLYDRFEITFDSILPATDAVAFQMRTSSNGGASFDSGASDYCWAHRFTWVGGSSANTGSADGEVWLSNETGSLRLSNVAGESLSGHIMISNPAAAARCKFYWSVFYFTDNTTDLLTSLEGAGACLAAADVDAFRFFMSSGNIASGTFRVYGHRK